MRRIIDTEIVYWHGHSQPPPVGVSVIGRTQDNALGSVLVYHNGREWSLTTYGDRYRQTGVKIIRWCFLPGENNDGENDQ